MHVCFLFNIISAKRCANLHFFDMLGHRNATCHLSPLVCDGKGDAYQPAGAKLQRKTKQKDWSWLLMPSLNMNRHACLGKQIWIYIIWIFFFKKKKKLRKTTKTTTPNDEVNLNTNKNCSHYSNIPPLSVNVLLSCGFAVVVFFFFNSWNFSSKKWKSKLAIVLS